MRNFTMKHMTDNTNGFPFFKSSHGKLALIFIEYLIIEFKDRGKLNNA